MERLSDAEGLLETTADTELGAVSSDQLPRRIGTWSRAGASAVMLAAVLCLTYLLQSRPGGSNAIDSAQVADFVEFFDLTGMATEKCYLNKTYYVELSGQYKMPGTSRTMHRNAFGCQQKCARTPGCEHFSFWMDGGCLLTSYSAYATLHRDADGKDTSEVISGPRICKEMSDGPTEVLAVSFDVPQFIAQEAAGCKSLHDEYELAWRAQGETFFEDWQFINVSKTRGAEWYLNKSEAFYQGTVTAAKEGAMIRVGEQVHPFKRRSIMLHTAQAWRPDPGFIVVMKYKHVPFGPGVWPAFWLLNTDLKWPEGGELDILEYANYDTAKVTFHTDKNCSMNVKKLMECTKKMQDVNPTMTASCYTNYSGNELGCLPPQVRKTGEWFSRNPGAVALVWDASGITSFHIPEAEIPEDLESDTPRPNTWKDSWRMAFMPFDQLSCQDIARPQEIVLNIALCGDWAGNTFYQCEQCRATGYKPNYCVPGHVTEPATDCCTLYMSNPSAEKPLKEHAYFDITYMKVFTPKGAKLPKYSSGTYRNGGVEADEAPQEMSSRMVEEHLLGQTPNETNIMMPGFEVDGLGADIAARGRLETSSSIAAAVERFETIPAAKELQMLGSTDSQSTTPKHSAAAMYRIGLQLAPMLFFVAWAADL